MATTSNKLPFSHKCTIMDVFRSSKYEMTMIVKYICDSEPYRAKIIIDQPTMTCQHPAYSVALQILLGTAQTGLAYLITGYAINSAYCIKNESGGQSNYGLSTRISVVTFEPCSTNDEYDDRFMRIPVKVFDNKTNTSKSAAALAKATPINPHEVPTDIHHDVHHDVHDVPHGVLHEVKINTLLRMTKKKSRGLNI